MRDDETTTSQLSAVTGRYQRRAKWLRRIGLFLAIVSVVPSLFVLWIDGHVPWPTPATKEPFSVSPLAEVYKLVDSRTGAIDMNLLENKHEPLDRYVAQLASISPLNEPESFPKPADKLAYWLNAYHALIIQQMVEVWPGANDARALSYYRRTWPIGGSRLTLFSIERRFLKEAEDPRVFLALFTGARGSGQLDGAPFDPATLEAQLNDAARRFIRKKENVTISGSTVWLSAVFKQHEAAFLAAAPPERRHLLQIVWAFLPDDCQGERPGCDTRGDLDRVCGPAFESCKVEFAPVDQELAVRSGN